MKRTIYENESQIPTKYITKKQTPETNEAVYLLSKQKAKFKLAIYIICFIIFLSLIMVITQSNKSEVLMLIFGIIYILSIMSITILFVIRHEMLKPYYELLNTAINNDRIRHEERIRFRERKRLEQQEIIDYSKKEKYLISSKKMTKNTLKEIKQLKTLKQEEQTFLKPQVNIEKIRELQQQIKNQNKGEN